MDNIKNNIFSVRENPSGFQKKPFLVMVGKKVAIHATKRNLIRRRLIAAFRFVKQFPRKDITIIAKPQIVNASFESILAEIKKSFHTK